MENQTILNSSSAMQIKISEYKHHKNSVGNNLQSIQITTKYLYQMMRKDKIKTFCKVSIEEACKRHKIEISILKVLDEHVHLIVDCPRTMSIAKLLQIIKGLSAYNIAEEYNRIHMPKINHMSVWNYLKNEKCSSK